MKKPKAKKEAITVERPLLTELIYECAKLFNAPASLAQWSEVFYNLSLQENAPKCLQELVWGTKDGFLQSHDLNYLLSFCQSLDKIPGNVG